MRQKRPDKISPILVVSIMILMIAPASMAEDNGNEKGQSGVSSLGIGICVDVWNNFRPCNPPDYLSFNWSIDQVMSQDLWFPDESDLSRRLGGNSFFSMKGGHCKSRSRSRDKHEILRAIFGDKIPDMRIDFSQYLAFDVKVDATNGEGIQLARVYLGYKDCW